MPAVNAANTSHGYHGMLSHEVIDKARVTFLLLELPTPGGI